MLADCGSGRWRLAGRGRRLGTSAGRLYGLEFPVDEATDGAGAILFDAFEQAGVRGVRLVVGEWLLIEVSLEAIAAGWRLDGLKARRERTFGGVAA
jgi:hypothetical protein